MSLMGMQGNRGRGSPKGWSLLNLIYTFSLTLQPFFYRGTPEGRVYINMKGRGYIPNWGKMDCEGTIYHSKK